jgi:outer membrane receptor for ferrienterochelin and colicin
MIRIRLAALAKGLLAGIVLIFAGTNANAQSKNFRISGFVRDSASKALPYVTVGLYKTGNTDQAVKSTYTNETGKYQFNAVDTGRYTVIFSHTGFGEQQQEVTVGNQDITTTDISLVRANNNLKGVTVTAKKPLIEQTDDKVIFNVENDPATKTETALDILRKTPFVSVDGDDNVQVNGQSNFKVLLNGRETSMFAQNVKDALKGFPGALITKIEVITSPSAKYDGEGVGGVINIITKKKVAGYNGSINAHASTIKWGNLNSNFSAKFGKLGITTFYGAGGTPGQTGKNLMTTTPKVPSLFSKRQLAGDREMKNFWNNGNVEFSYELDSMNTLSSYANISGGSNSMKLDQTVKVDYPSGPSSESYYHLNSRNEYPTIGVGTDYIRKFKENKEKEFSIRFNGEFGKANSFLNSVQDNPATDRFIINTSIASNRQYTLQSDYILPFKNNHKLESGVKAVLRRATSDFESLIKYDRTHDYKVNPANTDYFSYRQDVYSAYSTYSFKVKKTTFRLGARVEHTTVDGDFNSSDTKVNQTYTTLLPNLQATTKLNNIWTLVYGYNKRLQRPYIWNLNPFVNNNDSLNIFYGNPGLDPQTIHAVSVQTRYMKAGNFAGLTFEVNYSGNKILQYSNFDPATGVTRTTSLNIGKELQVSITGNISTKINKDWNVFINGNVRYNKVKNSLDPSQYNSGIGGNANLNTTYKIGKKFTATGYAGFWRGPVSIQATYPLNIWYGTGIGYKMFKEKLTASLMAVNYFQETRDWRMVTNDPYFQTESVTTMPFRGLGLSLTWNFGKLTENVSKKKGVTNDDLLGNGSSGGN